MCIILVWFFHYVDGYNSVFYPSRPHINVVSRFCCFHNFDPTHRNHCTYMELPVVMRSAVVGWCDYGNEHY